MIKYPTFALLPLIISYWSCTEEVLAPSEPSEPFLAEDLSEFEIQYITDLMTVEAEMENYWKGFNCIRNTPIILIVDKNDALIFNIPSRLIPESTPVPSVTASRFGLTLYRNDELLEFAKKTLTPQWWYRFYEEFEGVNYYLYDATVTPMRGNGNFYFNYKNRNGKFHISVFLHELFHSYSILKSADSYVSNQEELPPQGSDYPISNESLPYIMLLFEVMMDAYHLDSESEKRKYLEYYVSIHNQLDRLDTTSARLVNIGFHQEKTEGAARYIEVFSTLNTISNNTIDDPSHGYKEFAENITQSSEIGNVYGFRIFYHTGAGAIHLLKELGYPEIEKELFIPNNAPYFIAKRFLDLDQEALDKNLDELKSLYNWNEIVSRSERLLSLD